MEQHKIMFGSELVVIAALRALLNYGDEGGPTLRFLPKGGTAVKNATWS